VLVTGCGRLVVVIRRTVGLVAVVVVVTVGHVVPPHASQQLGISPAQALLPFGALHAAALRLTRHVCTPVAVVRQQVTDPDLRQVDFAAHFFTAPLHSLGSVRALTAAVAWWATQLTYCPWVGAVAQPMPS